MNRPRIAGLSAILVGAILLRSSIGHIENSHVFLQNIYAYDLLSPTGGLLLAVIIPYLQLVLAVCFFVYPSNWRAAFAISGALFALLSVAQLTTLFRGLNISCGCFGSAQNDPIGYKSIFLAVGCMAASIVGFAAASGDGKIKTVEPLVGTGDPNGSKS